MTMPASLRVHSQIKLARTIEALGGVDRLWYPDHLSYPDFAHCPEIWTVLSAVAAHTRRVKIGTAVTDPHRVAPAVFAQRAATLDQLSRGRLLIGLGSGESMNLDAYGIPWDRRLTRLKDTVHIVRGLLDRDEPFSYEGATASVRNARIFVRPHKNRRIPIYLAALGPKMQQFCGEVCDGWYPVVIPPEHYAHYYTPIEDARRAAGRTQPIDRVATIPLALIQERPGTRETVVAAARKFALVLVWPPVLERMGTPLRPPEHLGDIQYLSVNPLDKDSRARYEELQDWIPDDLLLQFVWYGSMTRLKKVVGDYLDAGATSVNLVNVSPDPLSSTARFVTELIPAFTRRAPSVAARVFQISLPLLTRLGIVNTPAASRRLTIE